MFIIVKISDVVEVEPAYFSPELQPDRLSTLRAPKDEQYVPTLEDVLWHRISERYVGRVVPRRGLCIAIGDLSSHSNSTVRGNDGSSWTTVVFDAVVFRPDIGERIKARIHRQTEKGLYLSVDFFHEIFVPAAQLLQPSIYDDVAGTWYLQLDGGDEEGSAAAASSPSRNAYKSDDLVLVCIREVLVRSAVDQLSIGDTCSADSVPLMTVTGSFNSDVGLGPCAWYD